MPKKRRILAIDGGGIKGVMPAAFLATIEETTGKRVRENFDLIAGTSTGGIIALGLGLGFSAAAMMQFYRQHGPSVFAQPNTEGLTGWLRSWIRKSVRNTRRLVAPKYDAEALRAALSTEFGVRTLGESSVRLVIPAYDAPRRTVYVFKTAHHDRLRLDWKQRAVDVALATAAAPTFFPSHILPDGTALIDGGVWANNPAGMAAVEAVGVLGWGDDDIYILSLGCTEELYVCPQDASGAQLLLSVGSLFLQGQSKSSLGTAKLLSKHADDNPRLFRYNVEVPSRTFELDDAAKIKDLEGFGCGLAREASPVLERVFFDQTAEAFIPVYGASSTHSSNQ